MASKLALPSEPQARLIARLWADDRRTDVMVKSRDGDLPYNDATTNACVKRGWLEPSTETFSRNGFDYQIFTLANKGIDALETFLMEQRRKRDTATR